MLQFMTIQSRQLRNRTVLLLCVLGPQMRISAARTEVFLAETTTPRLNMPFVRGRCRFVLVSLFVCGFSLDQAFIRFCRGIISLWESPQVGWTGCAGIAHCHAAVWQFSTWQLCGHRLWIMTAHGAHRDVSEFFDRSKLCHRAIAPRAAKKLEFGTQHLQETNCNQAQCYTVFHCYIMLLDYCILSAVSSALATWLAHTKLSAAQARWTTPRSCGAELRAYDVCCHVIMGCQ